MRRQSFAKSISDEPAVRRLRGRLVDIEPYHRDYHTHLILTIESRAGRRTRVEVAYPDLRAQSRKLLFGKFSFYAGKAVVLRVYREEAERNWFLDDQLSLTPGARGIMLQSHEHCAQRRSSGRR